MNRLLTTIMLIAATSTLLTACGATPAGQAHASLAPSKPAPSSTASTPSPAPLPTLHVHKSAQCGCCGEWVERMQSAGFTVQVNTTEALMEIKQRLGVPAELASCHTTQVGGYFVEGHVPAEDIKRLLAEKPRARGLALPGMPLGSPGMESPDGRRQPYTVAWVDDQGNAHPFSRHP